MAFAEDKKITRNIHCRKLIVLILKTTTRVPVPVVARSKVRVYGRSPTAIVGSNPTGGMDDCLLCVLSGRCLCDELITRPEAPYRLWCVVVCDQETSWTRRPWPALGCRATGGHSPRWAAQTQETIARAGLQSHRRP
jgi:hypothetical protein